MSEWQPIETAPMDGEWMLLAGESGYVHRPYFATAGRWDAYKQRWEGTESNPLSDYGIVPTHWMPLPAPPKP
jgi:hypothetical protein